MIGTSAAARLVYAAGSAVPRPGLFLYRLDELRFCEGGALSDGGNVHAWLMRTLRDVEPGLADRPPAAHGLTFLAFLGGERSLGWDADRRGTIRGLSFATSATDIAQAALEGVCYQLADILDALGDIDSVVATGGGLLASPDWTQILADVLGRTVEVSAVAEGSARGAAMMALERSGFIVPPAPIARSVDPRPGAHEIHLAARAEHQETIRKESA
jgi:gluconokinase